MQVDDYWAMTLFAFVMAFTPGPNNIMLAASGANFGLAHSTSHVSGVVVGFAVLVLACGAGLGLVFAAAPGLQVALKIVGALYMLWLAYKVATAQRSDGESGAARPFNFWQAALFQWVNPKGLLAALSGIAIYVRPEHEKQDFVVMLAVFTLVTLASALTWTAFGVGLRRLLQNPTHARVFNIGMAVLLIASIVPMVA